MFTTGRILRRIFSYRTANMDVYIAKAIFIYLALPVYSAALYNLVGRSVNYLPMHALLNPDRVLIFVYVGAAVEVITAAGAAKNAAAGLDIVDYKSGGKLIAAGLVLQALVECLLVGIVTAVHIGAVRARMISRNLQTLCVTLYGTSTLALLRCIFRAAEAFETFDNIGYVDNCGPILSNEWYLYAFEFGPCRSSPTDWTCFILGNS